MEEKEMNRTVYPLRFKNKGWKIANKCAEIFIILLVAGAEAFFMALYSGWVLNLIEPGEPQVGDRILLLWPILPCIALLVALIVQLPKPKTHCAHGLEPVHSAPQFDGISVPLGL